MHNRDQIKLDVNDLPLLPRRRRLEGREQDREGDGRVGRGCWTGGVGVGRGGSGRRRGDRVEGGGGREGGGGARGVVVDGREGDRADLAGLARGGKLLDWLLLLVLVLLDELERLLGLTSNDRPLLHRSKLVRGDALVL